MSQTKWQEIIAELKKAGWTQAAIGKECGVSQAAINQIKLGLTKEPSHSIGEKLIKLLNATTEEG
jgi:transcriptional regulator with XRE-family HTH domain